MLMYVPENPVDAAFLARPRQSIDSRAGSEPSLVGTLREKAFWVEEVDCIGCHYCAHVASNTFVMVLETGRCRAIRQDGDSLDRIQETIDTCPVDCIHWVDFENLD